MAEKSSGRLGRAFAGGRTARLVAVDVRRIAERAAAAHGLGPEATRVAAEGIVATALMSAYIKGDERITLEVQSLEPRAAFIGEVDAEGGLRARLTPPDLQVPDDRLDGVMVAIKADAQKELYRGNTRIDGQTIEQALVHHLAGSSQVDVILRIEVRMEGDALAFAAGFLIERLPEDPTYPWISAEEFQTRYAHLRDAPLEDVLVGLAFGKVGQTEIELLEDRELRWQCRCGVEKVETMVGSLGVDEMQEMIAEGGAEVTCHFCNTTWRVAPERLQQLIDLYRPN